MYDAVLFDLDGTLIDSESVAIRTGLVAFASLGHPVADDFLHAMIGKDSPTASGMIAAALPHLDIVRLNDLWSRGFQAEMDRNVPLKPQVHAVLRGISLPRAIVTSSRRAEAKTKLTRAALFDFFAHVVVLEDVTAPKPAPDPYLLAARLFGLDPARCLVFEDSETGAESAHRAGCTVVQIPDIVPSTGRWAHYVAADLVAGAAAAGLAIRLP
jgi:beta-phosphoglucomutase-like phosphatase (HAD superfamily)